MTSSPVTMEMEISQDSISSSADHIKYYDVISPETQVEPNTDAEPISIDKKERPAKKSGTNKSRRQAKNKGNLPPCRVCGDEASGFHYGVYTCEGCKGFFRRALKLGPDFKCSFQNKCDVSGPHRKLCASCRYRRCLDVGMSKKAIRIGRYTYETRTRNTLESRLRKEEEIRNKHNPKPCSCHCHTNSSQAQSTGSSITTDSPVSNVSNVSRDSTVKPEATQKTSSGDTTAASMMSTLLSGPTDTSAPQQYQSPVDQTSMDADVDLPQDVDNPPIEGSNVRSTYFHFGTSFEECCPDISPSTSTLVSSNRYPVHSYTSQTHPGQTHHLVTSEVSSSLQSANSPLSSSLRLMSPETIPSRSPISENTSPDSSPGKPSTDSRPLDIFAAPTYISFPSFQTAFPKGKCNDVDELLVQVRATENDIDHTLLEKYLEGMAKLQQIQAKRALETEYPSYYIQDVLKKTKYGHNTVNGKSQIYNDVLANSFTQEPYISDTQDHQVLLIDGFENHDTQDHFHSRSTCYSRNSGECGTQSYSPNLEQCGPQSYSPNLGQFGLKSCSPNSEQCGPQSYSPNSGHCRPQSCSPNLGQSGQQMYSPNSGQHGPQSYSPNSGHCGPQICSPNSEQCGQQSYSPNSGQCGQRSYSPNSVQFEQLSYSINSGHCHQPCTSQTPCLPQNYSQHDLQGNEMCSLYRPLGGGNDFQLDSITYDLIRAHNKFILVNSYLPDDFVKERQQACLREHARRQELLGNKVLTEAEFLELQDMTGLDVDGRIKMMTLHSGFMEAAIRNMIRFVKKIPGFCELPLEDRTKMIKAARPMIILFGAYKGFNKDLQISVTPHGHGIHRDDLLRMFTKEFVDGCFDVAENLQKINCCMSPVHTVLLKCLALTAINSSCLIDPVGVEKIRHLILACLKRSLRGLRVTDDSIEDCTNMCLRTAMPIVRLEKLNQNLELFRKYHMEKPLIRAFYEDSPLRALDTQ